MRISSCTPLSWLLSSFLSVSSCRPENAAMSYLRIMRVSGIDRVVRRSILTALRIGRFAPAALMVALAGCALGPDFVPPAPQLPATFDTGEPATVDPWLQQPPDP